MKLFGYKNRADALDKAQSNIADISLAKTESYNHISTTQKKHIAFAENTDKEVRQHVAEINEAAKWIEFG